jgi:hypothetical protein
VRVLLDECLPRKLKDSLPGHECATAPESGLAGKKNGQLLSLAESMGFDLFLTLDKSIEYQQNLTDPQNLHHRGPRKIESVARHTASRTGMPCADAENRAGATGARGLIDRTKNLGGQALPSADLCHHGQIGNEESLFDYRRLMPG